MSKAHEQTTPATPATWRGEVKVQVELWPNPGSQFLVTSEDGAILASFPTSKALRKLLNSRKKGYFKATLLGDGTLDIRQGVPDRSW